MAMPVHGAEFNNEAALSGVTGTNAVFDVSPGGVRLLAQLNVIHKTYEQLVAFGHKPRFVLAFRGAATKYVTKDNLYIPINELAVKKKIRQRLNDLKELDVRMELCAIAAESQKVAPEDFLPGIEVVANGYISVIGYQNKGYSLVPIY
jgi:intracellular sulfur oxidation DsrE/DsrF family protein